MASINDLIKAELAKRVGTLSTEELTQLLAASGGRRSRRPASGTHRLFPHGAEPPRASTPPAGQLTIAGAILDACTHAGRPLTSSELVVQVQALRPNTPPNSVRSEVSRMASAGQLRLTGTPRHGVYSVPVVRHRAAG